MLHILEPGGRYFFFASLAPHKECCLNETKSLAHRPVCHGAPPLYRQCLRLERPHQAHHGIYGLHPKGNDVDLFPGHPIPRPVGRLFGQFRPENRPSQVRPLIHDLLRHGHVRHGSGSLCPQPAHALRLLRRHRRRRPGDGLYHACIDTGQMVPGKSGLCYGPGYHGLRFCQPHRRSGHAAAGPAFWLSR